MQAGTRLFKQRVSWVVLALAGVAVALASLLFDAWRFDLLSSSNGFAAVLYVFLSLSDGSFAYVLLPLCAGVSSRGPREAMAKSGLSLALALITYYVATIGFNIRPTDATGRLLMQAALWCLAAALLSVIVAPLAFKMTVNNYPYRQVAAGIVLSVLGAPYWFALATQYADGLFLVSELVCSVIPVVLLLYRLRYKNYLQLFISTGITSVVCVTALFAIYQLGY